MGGEFRGKVLAVDLSTGAIEEQSIPDDLWRRYIGGSGLGARMLYDETDAGTDPLGAANPLVFMTGPLTGTVVPSSGRHAVVSKSPLSGIWGEANSGGTWGTQLRRAGYEGVIVQGKASRPVCLVIRDGAAELCDASDIWGRDTYEASELIKGWLGDDAVATVIGTAGERMVRISGIFSDGKHARAAARSGLGAVMGSKLLKAIVVRGTRRIPVSDPDGLKESVRRLLPAYVNATQSLRNWGTACLVIPCEEIGDFPVKNWRDGSWKGAEQISGERMAKTILTSRYHCANCSIGCGRTVRIDGGQGGGLEGSTVDGAGPEYETLGVFGGSCLIGDLRVIAQANELCNRYGIDTIEVGNLVAFAIEAFEAGLIGRRNTGGIELKWNDPRTLIGLIHQIGRGEYLGEVLGQGLKAASQYFGGLALEMAIHSKGLGFPAHDPRAYNSIALGYATSNRGACHLQGFSHVFERNLVAPELGIGRPQNRFDTFGKGEFVAKLQDLMAIFDSLVVCKFSLFGGSTITHLVQWINMVAGWDVDVTEVMRAGERIFNLKRLYNVRCGISRKDDVLPPRILTHRRGTGGAAQNLPHLGAMLSEYYQYRGWTPEGIPTSTKLAELGIADEEG